MQQIVALAAFALALPGAAMAASRSYDTRAFDRVSVSAGIEVEITIAPGRSVVAETSARDFDDLKISVEGSELRIQRPKRSWFSFWRRQPHQVQVVMPALKALQASSGAQVQVRGPVQGDVAFDAFSGSEITVASTQGGLVKAHLSSGSEIRIAGSCAALDVEASSGSELEAGALKCEKVSVQASSGSDVSFGATRNVTGQASSGSQVHVRGGSSALKVQVKQSSGADVEVDR